MGLSGHTDVSILIFKNILYLRCLLVNRFLQSEHAYQLNVQMYHDKCMKNYNISKKILVVLNFKTMVLKVLPNIVNVTLLERSDNQGGVQN